MEKEMKMPQIVLTKKISLWEDLEIRNEGLIGTKKEILEILSKVLDKNQHPLFDLVLHTAGQGSTGPFVNNIYIFVRREVLLCNLQKIVEKIASKKEWRKEGVWVGFHSSKKPRSL